MRVLFNTLPIKRYLAEKNLSQRWLAIRIGTSSGYMSQLLSGERSPSPKMRQRILSELKHFEFNDLFVVKEHEGKAKYPLDRTIKPRKARIT